MHALKALLTLLIGPVLAGLLLAGLLTAVSTADAHSSPNVTGPDSQIQAEDADRLRAPQIRPSPRISIPYGFAPFFPLRDNGQQVLVEGHGSCSSSETFSVAVTVTHDATGVMATGNTSGACAGEDTLVTWTLTATAVTTTPLTLGPAETCGLVQTDDGGGVTDQQAWCVDVHLGDYLFLPIVMEDS